MPQPALAGERPMEPPWYSHGRYADLLSLAEKLAETLAGAEARAGVARGVVKVADRTQVGGHESSYLLPAAPPQSGYRTRDGQPRMRRDGFTVVGRAARASSRHPQQPDTGASPRTQRPWTR